MNIAEAFLIKTLPPPLAQECAAIKKAQIEVRNATEELSQRLKVPPLISIIIAHRGPMLGLWATIRGCLLQLDRSSLTYEFRIAVNGQPFDAELQAAEKELADTSPESLFIWREQALSPPSARNLGARDARGKYLFFLDNHTIPHADYFQRGVALLQRANVDMVHAATQIGLSPIRSYHYVVDRAALEKNFWNHQIAGTMKLPDGRIYGFPTDGPYRVTIAGHGGFAIKRETWEQVGGYFDGFQGWAGEESYFDLKMWLMGKSVWLDPQMVYDHHFSERSYARHFTDDYYRNMLMSANIIGGPRWLETLTKSFSGEPRATPEKSMVELAREAQERSAERAAWLASKQTMMTLDEFLDSRDERQIIYKQMAGLENLETLLPIGKA